MMVYIWFRFEWQFGVGAPCASPRRDAHDRPVRAVPARVRPDIVAALLTIVGYSVNDTVVVSDRIRENLRKYKTMPLRELIDLSINETLSRTVITSVTAVLVLVALFFFGGEVLHSFRIALIVGIVIGTYSSIFIATPLVLYLNLRRGTAAEEKALAETP